MTTSDKTPSSTPSHSRLFYPIASLVLLGITAIGFQLFYIHGKAFPGRELTPPIHSLLIVHGVLMTAWMLISVLQPLLVATGLKRIHMMIGRGAAVLAGAMIFVGIRVAIAAARVNPPDLKIFGLTPKEFVIVPLISIAAFAIFVFVGVLNRKRPEVHRPMMLMASLAAVSAALGRIPLLNAWYANTWLEQVFGAFLVMLVIGGLMLLVKCVWSRSFDRWFATGFAALVIMTVAASLMAKTQAWVNFATFLLG